MPDTELGKILQGLRAQDIRIDQLGRITINNPEIANKLNELGGIEPDLAAARNFGCCKNLAKCGLATVQPQSSNLLGSSMVE